MEQTLLVGLVVGVVEVIKRAGVLDSKYAPLAALAFGVALSLLGGLNVDNVLAGVMGGLIAAGAYDVGKYGYGVVKGK